LTFVLIEQSSDIQSLARTVNDNGGDENALFSLGSELWPGAALLGLRGKVLEDGMPRSFRRFTEVGIGDVRSKTEELEFSRA
jgi:phospholipase/carboxylesterase